MKELCDWMVVMVAHCHWTIHLKVVKAVSFIMYFITIKKTTKGKTFLKLRCYNNVKQMTFLTS